MTLADLAALVQRADVRPIDQVKCGETGAWHPAGREPLLSSYLPKDHDPNNTDEFEAAPAVRREADSGRVAPQNGAANQATNPEAKKASSAAKGTLPSDKLTPASASPGQQPPPLPAAAPSPPDEERQAANESRAPRSRRLVLAGAAVLVICGASAGAAARLFLGGSAPAPNRPATSPAVEQQQIAALTQEIEELKRRRDELNAKAGAAKAPAPSEPNDEERQEASPASDEQPSSEPGEKEVPAKSPAPASSDKASDDDAAASKTQEPSTSQPTDASPQDHATKPDAADAPAAKGKSMSAASVPAPTPAAAPANGAGLSAASGSQTSGKNGAPLAPSAERLRQRLDLLRQIYARRQELLADYARLETEAKTLAETIASTEETYGLINTAGPLLLTRIAQEQSQGNAAAVTSLQNEYALLDAQAAELKVLRQKQAAQQEELFAKLKRADDESAELRSNWLVIVDPFGQLDYGDPEAAIAAFSEWTALEPKSPGSWLARGFAYWQLNRLEDALADFNLAVKIGGPMSSNSLAARGGLLHVMQRPKEAMADFGRALKFNKADGMVYLFRGRVLCAEEKFASALKDFKTAIQLNTKDPEAYRNLALVLATCPQSRYRNGKQAVDHAKKACELTEWNSWTAIDTLAAAHAEAGDFDEARQLAEKAAKMAYGANHDQCMARLKQYESKQPLRLDWKSQYENASAVADAPISK